VNGKKRTNQQNNRSVTNRENTDNLSLCCTVLYVAPNERGKRTRCGSNRIDQQKRRGVKQTWVMGMSMSIMGLMRAKRRDGGMARDFIAMHIRMTWFKVKVMVNQFDQSIVQSVQTATVLYCTYKRGDLARAVYPLLSSAPLTLTERETGCSSINSSSSRGGVSIESYGARGRVQHSIAKVARQQQFTREKGTDWHTAYCTSHTTACTYHMPLAHTATLGTSNRGQKRK
jgi:hypothetical protein